MGTIRYVEGTGRHNGIINILLGQERIDAEQSTGMDVGSVRCGECHTGHVEIIKLLLAHDGIDANQARTLYLTPLSYST